MSNYNEAMKLRGLLIHHFIDVNREKNFFIDGMPLENFVIQHQNTININTRLLKWDFYFDHKLESNLHKFIQEIVCLELKYICKEPIRFTANNVNGIDVELFTLLPAGLGVR